MCRDTDCLHCRSCGPIRVFFRASCSWWSEGLFGQSFSVALPIQALRGLPYLWAFSVVYIRHIAGPPRAGALLCRLACQALKGAPWVRSYSVVQCVRRLMGQPLYSSAVDAGMLGERGYGDGSTLYMWLSSIALLPWLPVFPPQAFPTTISSHIPPVVLSMVNSSPRHRIPPQSLNSSSQLLCLLGDLHPCLGYVWVRQGLSDSHSIEAATDQLFHSQP